MAIACRFREVTVTSHTMPDTPAVNPRTTRGSVRNEFGAWCRDELFTPTMIEAMALLQLACDLHLAGLHRSLALARHLESPKTAAQLATELGYTDTAGIALEAVLLRLADRTRLVSTDPLQDQAFFTAREEGADPSPQLDQVRQAICALGDGYRAAMEFLDFGAEHFVEALRDDPEFMDKVLTGRDARFAKLWHRATNADPLQDVHGIMGAWLIEKIFRGGRILEVGGGTGNGMRHVVRYFSNKDILDRIESYVFTDISLSFILSTRLEMMRAYPSIKAEWRHLDMNKPFAAQKFAPQCVDLVYGVNAAHCTRDIVEFLRQCRMTLRDGGKAVFAERVRMKPREMAPRELALNLSIYHRTAANRNSEYRPMHGYLTAKNWLRALELAGFSRAEVYPDLDALAPTLGNQYAAVIVADK
jgi:SAM-dependent methyltransferase